MPSGESDAHAVFAQDDVCVICGSYISAGASACGFSTCGGTGSFAGRAGRRGGRSRAGQVPGGVIQVGARQAPHPAADHLGDGLQVTARHI